MIRIALLGPLEVEVDGTPVVVSGAIRRALVARLAVDAGRVVPVERLVSDVWGDQPPRTAVGTIQTYVSQLRKHLGPALGTRAPGYVLELDPAGLDTSRFATAFAARRYDDALREWRGEPLAEFDAEWARHEAARLSELHVEALERRAEQRLDRGELASLVPELEALVSEHPLRERLWALLVTALFRAGRQSDALRAYQRLRETLAETLGIEPSPELRELELAVLNQQLASAEPSTTLPSGVVTFLLTDIEGSTAMWDAEPDAMADALDQHDSLIAKVVHDAGGRLLKSKGEGDATFNVFTRATDAAAAAMAIQDEVQHADWPTATPVRVRIAVATGEAIERDGDYYGSTVNRAARLRALAMGGEVLIGESSVAVVRDHLPPGADLTELGARDLAGLSRSEHVWVLGDPARRDDERERRTRGDDPEPVLPAVVSLRPGEVLVGRDVEVAHLRELLNDVRTRGRRAVFVGGEPGIGKTRLAAAVARDAHEAGFLVVFGRCEEDLGAAHQPFAEAMRSIVAAAPLDDLRDHVAACGGELTRLVPELGSRLSRVPEPVDAEVETAQLRLYEAVVDLVRRCARDRPAVLVLDDMHWASPSTAAMTRHLLLAEDLGAVLVLVTYRDTEVDRSHSFGAVLASLHDLGRTERLALKGLDVPGVEAMLASATGRQIESDDREFAAALTERTSGNPFFASQVVGHLVEAGAFVRDGGPTAGGSMAALGLPEGVVDVVGRRLDRLSPAANRALTTAAVIGLDFSLSLLEAIPEATEDPDTLIDVLDEAVRARLLTEVATARYSFSHAIVRDVLLRELPGAKRARLHRSIARALEARVGTHPGPHVQALAHHYTEAAALGDVRSAARYAGAAASWALDHADPRGAIDVLETALAVVDAVEPVDPEARYDVTVELASTYLGAGVPGEARRWALEASDSARVLDDPRRLLRAAVAGNFQRFGSLDDDIAGLFREAAAGLDDPSPELAVARAGLLSHESDTYHPDELWRRSAEALAMAELFVDEAPALTAATRHRRAMSLSNSPDTTERVTLLDQLVATPISTLHDEPMARDVTKLSPSIGLRAIAHLAAGDRDRFEADLAGTERLSERSGSKIALGFALSCRGLEALMDGRWDDSTGWATKILEALPDVPNQVMGAFGQLAIRDAERGDLDAVGSMYGTIDPGLGQVPLAIAMWAQVQALSGDHEGAGATLDRLLADPRRDLVSLSWTTTLCYRAATAADSDHVETARDVLPRLEPYRGKIAIVLPCAHAWGAFDRARGQALYTLSRFDEAIDALEAAVALEQQIRSDPLSARSRYWLARGLLARDGQGDAERARTEAAASLAVAERLGMTELTRSAASLT